MKLRERSPQGAVVIPKLHRYWLDPEQVLESNTSSSIVISDANIPRFSQDLQLIDVELPVALVNVATCMLTFQNEAISYSLLKLGGFLFFGQMVIFTVASYYIALAIPPIFGVLYLLQRYYQRTSRQLRLLDLEAKAPLL